jgi:hypothetical protein
MLNNSDLPPERYSLLVREISTDFSGSGKKMKTTDTFLAVSKFGETRQESDEEDDSRL